MMIPIYAVASLASLWSLQAAFFIDAVRDVYEVRPNPTSRFAFFGRGSRGLLRGPSTSRRASVDDLPPTSALLRYPGIGARRSISGRLLAVAPRGLRGRLLHRPPSAGGRPSLPSPQSR